MFQLSADNFYGVTQHRCSARLHPKSSVKWAGIFLDIDGRCKTLQTTREVVFAGLLLLSSRMNSITKHICY